jgi:hypothetical protein
MDELPTLLGLQEKNEQLTRLLRECRERMKRSSQAACGCQTCSKLQRLIASIDEAIGEEEEPS